MKNIVAIEVNDKYCGVLTDTGRLRLISSEEKRNFADYLKIENEINNLYIQMNNNYYKMMKCFKKVIISILIIIISLCLTGILFTYLLALTYIAMIFSITLLGKNVIKVLKRKKIQNNINCNISELNSIKKKYNIMEICVLDYTKKKYDNYIYDLAIKLKEFVKTRISENIKSAKIIYLDQSKMNEYYYPINIEDLIIEQSNDKKRLFNINDKSEVLDKEKIVKSKILRKELKK